jgi:molecular chaperone Hsp33
MPGCSDEVLEKLQEKSSRLPSMGAALSDGTTVSQYIEDNFSEFGVQELASEHLGFSCPCSREHFETFLGRLPQDEKDGIISDDKFPLELECLNCGTKYRFDKNEIIDIFKMNTPKGEKA